MRVARCADNMWGNQFKRQLQLFRVWVILTLLILKEDKNSLARPAFRKLQRHPMADASRFQHRLVGRRTAKLLICENLSRVVDIADLWVDPFQQFATVVVLIVRDPLNPTFDRVLVIDRL